MAVTSSIRWEEGRNSRWRYLPRTLRSRMTLSAAKRRLPPIFVALRAVNDASDQQQCRDGVPGVRWLRLIKKRTRRGSGGWQLTHGGWKWFLRLGLKMRCEGKGIRVYPMSIQTSVPLSKISPSPPNSFPNKSETYPLAPIISKSLQFKS